MSTGEYQVVSSRNVYTGRIFSLRADDVRMPDGSVATREIVQHPGAVAIVAIDDDDRVVLVRQYRHAVREFVLEVPAGLLDIAGEPALVAAQRELAEEAALTARYWDLFVDILPSPGMSDEAVRIFLARDLSDVPLAERYVPEHEEITMTVSRMPLNELVTLALGGGLLNAAAVAGVLAAEVARAQGWDRLRPASAPWPSRPER